MADTAEIQLSLATIWEYLRARIVSEDIGPYPQENIVIGAGVSKRKPGDPLEIARQDALAAGDAWNALCQGHFKRFERSTSGAGPGNSWLCSRSTVGSHV